MIASILFSFLLVSVIQCRYIELGTEWSDAEGLYQGDITLSPQEKAELFGNEESRPKRQVRIDKQWPGGVVYYELRPEIFSQMRYLIKQAMRYIMDRTCIKFIEDPNATNRIRFNLESYCSSFVGCQGGVQELRLSTGCMLMGNALHEISHALGIYHTASRYDRDDFLIVKTELFSGSDFTNFAKFTNTTTKNPIPFEYGSSMMYSAQEISEPRDTVYRNTMGLRVISFYDIIAIQSEYQCGKCSETLDCKNGGVVNQAKCDECFCPHGFGGKLCDDVTSIEFSKKLMASSNWTSFDISFGFADLFEMEFKRLVFFIEAPKNKTIQIQVTKMEGFACYTRCIWNGIEIKHMGDPRILNPVTCCRSQSDFNVIKTSKLNPSPIIMYSRYSKQNVTFQYRYIDENLMELPRINNTYDSFEYPA